MLLGLILFVLLIVAIGGLGWRKETALRRKAERDWYLHNGSI